MGAKGVIGAVCPATWNICKNPYYKLIELNNEIKCIPDSLKVPEQIATT